MCMGHARLKRGERQTQTLTASFFSGAAAGSAAPMHSTRIERRESARAKAGVLRVRHRARIGCATRVGWPLASATRRATRRRDFVTGRGSALLCAWTLPWTDGLVVAAGTAAGALISRVCFSQRPHGHSQRPRSARHVRRKPAAKKQTTTPRRRRQPRLVGSTFPRHAHAEAARAAGVQGACRTARRLHAAPTSAQHVLLHAAVAPGGFPGVGGGGRSSTGCCCGCAASTQQPMRALRRRRRTRGGGLKSPCVVPHPPQSILRLQSRMQQHLLSDCRLLISRSSTLILAKAAPCATP